jgi:hypothetical protein
MSNIYHFNNIREYITVQRNIINFKSKNIYLPKSPLSYTIIKIFNFSDEPFILHNNSKTDLIYNSNYILKQGTNQIQINSNKLVELTYFYSPELKKGKWNLIMN